MTKLEELKIAYSDASINLEVAQVRYNEVKRELVNELNKPKEELKKD